MTKHGHINKRLSRRRFKPLSRLIACFVEMMKVTSEAGKLQVAHHIKHNAAHRERFYIKYDEYSVNRPEIG